MLILMGVKPFYKFVRDYSIASYVEMYIPWKIKFSLKIFHTFGELREQWKEIDYTAAANFYAHPIDKRWPTKFVGLHKLSGPWIY